jgi:chemotaxis regulatin CheY-phosphate phosphatase CheZ
MRVKLAYSVNIEEIIEEVSRLFDYVADKEYSINKQTETIADLLVEERPEGALALMQKMRTSLAEMDARLADLNLILEGYIQYHEQQNGGNDELLERGPAMDSTSGDAVSGEGDVEQPDGSEV